MKVALIIPANIYFCPYLKIYTNILDAHHINYNVIYWDKEFLNEEGIRFQVGPISGNSFFKKIRGYYLYSMFVKKELKKEKYSKLVVFTPQLGLFLYFFLKKEYYKKFIFDYRDLSIEQNMKLFFSRFLNICGLICISSPGFKSCLPKGFDYILSHNIDAYVLRNALESFSTINPINFDKIVVSTIGGIRDCEANKEIIDALRNNDRFLIRFIGRGSAAELLRQYSVEQKVTNISFNGFYIKSEEAVFVAESSFLNIYYPKKKTHSTALSNRFYNSLLYKRPMIVTRGGIQSEYVEKYNLGVVIDDCSILPDRLLSYSNQFDIEQFTMNCKKLLLEIEADYVIFENRIINYLYCINDDF